MNKDDEILQQVASDWLKAMNETKTFLHELDPYMTEKNLDHNAAVPIARLGHINIAISTFEE